MLANLLALPGSLWTLIIYRFRFFSISGKLRIPSSPFVLVSNLAHRPHLGSPLMLSCPFWDRQFVLLLTPSLSTVPLISNGSIIWFISFCSLSSQAPLSLSLLIHHLIFQSICNFSERIKKMMFEIYFSLLNQGLWTFFPKPALLPVSCLPCLFPFSVDPL